MQHATSTIHYLILVRETNKLLAGWLADWLPEAGPGRQALLLPPLADRAPEPVGHHAAAVNI